MALGVLQREHRTYSHAKPPLMAWSMVGDGSMGLPSEAVRLKWDKRAIFDLGPATSGLPPINGHRQIGSTGPVCAKLRHLPHKSVDLKG
jgi:hypothetical protein